MDLIKDNNGSVLIIEAFHPGVFLLEEINERGLLKKDVAKDLELLPNHLSDIFAGKLQVEPSVHFNGRCMMSSNVVEMVKEQNEQTIITAKAK